MPAETAGWRTASKRSASATGGAVCAAVALLRRSVAGWAGIDGTEACRRIAVTGSIPASSCQAFLAAEIAQKALTRFRKLPKMLWDKPFRKLNENL
jgi:hypothetical protein